MLVGFLSLKKSMQTSQQQNNTGIINCQQQALITLENITITKQDDVLLKNITFSLVKGEGLFIHGRIGIGKTSLLRVINGHSDNFIGKIVLNKIPKIFFLSQHPYFPEDDFKRAVFYPYFANIPADDEFKQILDFLGIDYLAKFIDIVHEWRNILSSGEQ